jgi:polyisoprenoid-binding protein YceI
LQARVAGHPFVAGRPYRQRCPALWRQACDEDMTTTQQLTPELGHYDIDVIHSAATFRTRHLFGLGAVSGQLRVRSGSVDIAEPLTTSGIRAETEAATFHTGNPQRDRRVRSARFLDARHFPVISFSDGLLGADGRTIAGMLTVRDQARPATLQLSAVEIDGQSFTVAATVRIDRTDFGVTASPGLAGRYLDVSVRVRCVRTNQGASAHA